jgi:uncharacterized protein
VVRITADTNIYVSALAIGGKPLELLKLATSEKIELTISDAILDEIIRVLAGPKFKWTVKLIAETREFITELAITVVPTDHVEVVKADPADNKILECAQAGRSRVIVSGDKHLLRLKSYREVPIMTVSEFLSTWRSDY